VAEQCHRGKEPMHDENTVRRFVELRATGWTYGKLTTELNVWSG
jgi:hypothetical protein